MMDYHVYPIKDLRSHNTESEYCDCRPRIEIQENGDRLIVHNSWDGREINENKEFNMN